MLSPVEHAASFYFKKKPDLDPEGAGLLSTTRVDGGSQ
jgi:hypothetical protein